VRKQNENLVFSTQVPSKMVMNNNDKTKPEGSWPRQLFGQSKSSLNTLQSKTYFAHRYHDTQNLKRQNPFNALFSDIKDDHRHQANDTDSFQKVFEHELSLSANPVRSESSLSHLTVLNCYNETLDTKTFRLGRLDGKPFNYLPGQYITLSVVIAGKEYKRSYSLASSPSRQGSLEITVKRDLNGGVVSNWLNDHLKTSDTVKIKGPFGRFSCVSNAPQKILFLAAGSGIVPIMSMLRWLADTEAQVDVTLLLSFKTLYEIIYGDELNLIATRHNNIKLFITLTKEPLALAEWSGLRGRADEKMIADLVPDLAERAVYLCGPSLFMADCKINLLNLNLPTEQLFSESFTVNSLQVPEQANTKTSIIGRPSKRINGNYRIRFAKSGKTVASNGDISLLELAEKSGIEIGHECRAGNCGECMVKCLEGKVEMTDQAEIAEFDRKKGWVYACCAYPASNAVLDV
jgi:glycine betaine catabolism B